MANQINLLPTDLKTGKEVTRASRVVTRAVIVLGLIFFLVGASGFGILTFLSLQLQKAKEEQESLKVNIQNLEATEQQLVLIRDRLTKVQTVLSERKLYEVLNKYVSFIENLPEGASFDGNEMEAANNKLSLVARDSRAFSQVMSLILEGGDWEFIAIDSMRFDPLFGYKVTFEMF